jgi:hypothetical protein
LLQQRFVCPPEPGNGNVRLPFPVFAPQSHSLQHIPLPLLQISQHLDAFR